MGLYDVTIEDVAFTSGDTDLTLSTEKLIEANAEARRGNLFPDYVKQVVSAALSEDDGQSGTDKKVFVSIVLRIEAEDEDEAENVDVPEALLEFVANQLSFDMDRERNWEVLMGNTEEVEEQP